MGRDLFRRKALALFALVLAFALAPALPAEQTGARGDSSALSGPAALEDSAPPRGDPAGPGGLRVPDNPAAVVRHSRSSAPEFSLEIPDHPAIAHWEQYYARHRGPELAAALERARLFRRHIAGELHERGLPAELLALPVLESHYRVRAVSRSGAVGLWQIMINTAVPLGLRRDLWLDERRDFWLATRAALRKLEEDHRRFGSWPLALAAYNGGAGRLSRAIRAGESEDFWELRAKGLLPRETAEYVPKFYALARICSYPSRYGLLTPPGGVGTASRFRGAAPAGRSRGSASADAAPAVSWESSPLWVRIELERSVELALLSRASGVPEDLLVTANAELALGVTPPVGHRYALKVPADSQERVRAVLSDPQAELLRYQYHTVRTGDTFYGLSRHYAVAVELIQSANPAVDPRRMQLGTVLKVPVVGSAVREPPAAAPGTRVAYAGSYTVQAGDTLWGISQRYGVAAELLAAANHRDLDEVLRPGDTLRVPGSEGPREGSAQ